MVLSEWCTHGSAEQKKNREIDPFKYAQSILDKSQKIAIIPNASEDEKILNHLLFLWECEMIQSFWKTAWHFL